MKNFENAEKILIPKGRDTPIVLQWIEEQGYKPPLVPDDTQRCLHRY